MDYDHLFNSQLQKLTRKLQNFYELERCQGNFPKAKNYFKK